MSRLKYAQAPGKPRGRGYFPQLAGLGNALAAIERPDTSGAPRTEADVHELRAKQAAKLARRAARAGL